MGDPSLFPKNSTLATLLEQVNCSQCLVGHVETHYETGQILCDIGVVSGSDMTVEAALTKLAFVLGRDEWSLAQKCQVRGGVGVRLHDLIFRQAMTENIRGELTTMRVKDTQQMTSLSAEFIPRLAAYMRLSSAHEMRTSNWEAPDYR